MHFPTKHQILTSSINGLRYCMYWNNLILMHIAADNTWEAYEDSGEKAGSDDDPLFTATTYEKFQAAGLSYIAEHPTDEDDNDMHLPYHHEMPS